VKGKTQVIKQYIKRSYFDFSITLHCIDELVSQVRPDPPQAAKE
jgi:hypothetical protein